MEFRVLCQVPCNAGRAEAVQPTEQTLNPKPTISGRNDSANGTNPKLHTRIFCAKLFNQQSKRKVCCLNQKLGVYGSGFRIELPSAYGFRFKIEEDMETTISSALNPICRV